MRSLTIGLKLSGVLQRFSKNNSLIVTSLAKNALSASFSQFALNFKLAQVPLS